jgi:AraC-like DNA-binding protein
MQNKILQEIAALTKVDIVIESKKEQTLTNLCRSEQDNPITINTNLREQLKNGAERRTFPYLYQDRFFVFWGSFALMDQRIYVGPMCPGILTTAEKRAFYRFYGMEQYDTNALSLKSMQDVLYLMDVLSQLLLGFSCEQKQLLQLNGFEREPLENWMKTREQILLEEEYEDDDGSYRHTYAEERRICEAVMDGRGEDALYYSRGMDRDAGKLSDHPLQHWKNLCIVAVTICSRAAIEGGLSPRKAYQISGIYIKRNDLATTPEECILIRDDAVKELAETVAHDKKHQDVSYHIKKCRDYVASHYRNKIYLEDAASEIGISSSHLSHLFKNEMGITFQDYVNRIRVNKACNLLKYSDVPIAMIAEYVNFPNQSYFGKIFKKEIGMTPKEYRNRNQAEEW